MSQILCRVSCNFHDTRINGHFSITNGGALKVFVQEKEAKSPLQTQHAFDPDFCDKVIALAFRTPWGRATFANVASMRIRKKGRPDCGGLGASAVLKR